MPRTSLAERMNRLEERKARLARHESKIRADLSKQRTRRLVAVGMLVEQAGVLDLDDEVLYGALLSIAEDRHDSTRLRVWLQSGRRALDEARQKQNEKREPLTVTFPAPLPTAFTTRLRAAGLRPNKLLHHWDGMAEHAAVAALAAEQNGTVIRVRTRPLNESHPNAPAAGKPEDAAVGKNEAERP